MLAHAVLVFARSLICIVWHDLMGFCFALQVLLPRTCLFYHQVSVLSGVIRLVCFLYTL